MKRANPKRQNKNTLVYHECKGAVTITHQYTITSLKYAAAATATTVKATCSKKWAQACYHYSSAISNNPQWATLSCPTEAATSARDRITAYATATWSSQHRGAGWIDAQYRAHAKCQRDEYPPVYLLRESDTAIVQAGKSTDGQSVRYLPDKHNTGAASMWGNICFKVPLKALDDDKLLEAVQSSSFGVQSNVLSPSKLSQNYIMPV